MKKVIRIKRGAEKKVLFGRRIPSHKQPHKPSPVDGHLAETRIPFKVCRSTHLYTTPDGGMVYRV